MIEDDIRAFTENIPPKDHVESNDIVVFNPQAKENADAARRKSIFFNPGVITGTMPVPYGRLDFDDRQPGSPPTFTPRPSVQIDDYLPLRDRPLSSP